MTAPLILVTRAAPGADRTAAGLAARGYEARVEPLLAREDISPGAPPQSPVALAFTSAAGVRALAAHGDWRAAATGPVYCVGDHTRDAARAAGWTSALSAEGDADALLALILSAPPPRGMTLVHAGNAESRGELADRLQAAGVAARHLPVYRMRARETPGPRLSAHVAGTDAFDAVLLHSPAAARTLDSLYGASPVPLPACGLSAACLAPVATRPGARAIALRPDEGALLDALERLLHAG